MFARVLFIVAAVTAATLGSISGSALADCPAADSLRARWRPELERVVLAGLEETRDNPAELPFNTHWDWHSSVHAHWALLSMARDAGDGELASRIRARLTPEVLNTLRVRLAKKANRDFEVPYGQAWLLVLLGELERVEPSTELNAFRAETEARILSWLEKDFSSDLEHDSWLMAYWLVGQSSLTSESRARYQALSAKLAEKRPKLLKKDPKKHDFVSPAALLDLLDGQAGKLLLTPEAPPTTIKMENAHSAGRAFMELWPFAARASDESASCELFAREADARLSQLTLWEHPFHEVAHWTPQFAWMALWLARSAKLP